MTDAEPNSNPPEQAVAEYRILLEMLKQQGESIEALRLTVAQGHEKSSDSRSKLHERLDEFSVRLGQIEGDIRILGEVDGQVRERLKALAETVKKNQEEAQPTIDEWRRMKAIGAGLAGVLALFSVSLGAFAIWAGESLIAGIRHILRIN